MVGAGRPPAEPLLREPQNRGSQQGSLLGPSTRTRLLKLHSGARRNGWRMDKAPLTRARSVTHYSPSYYFDIRVALLAILWEGRKGRTGAKQQRLDQTGRARRSGQRFCVSSSQDGGGGREQRREGSIGSETSRSRDQDIAKSRWTTSATM